MPVKNPQNVKSSNYLGIGLDCSVIPLRYNNLVMIQSTDFFYPLIDDPYLMGKIAFANVVSDVYSMGVTIIDSMLMILGISTKMTDRERDVTSSLLIQGFKDAAVVAGTVITGGDTTLNPWCTIGGVATSICNVDEYIMPVNAVPGDVLVLTKPLGSQMAVIAHSLMNKPEKWNHIRQVVTEEEVNKAFHCAVQSMARLNKTAAELMHVYNAHAATDVTGFGLLGHAQNLAKFQKNEISFVIHNLPILAKMVAVAKACNNTKLTEGLFPETSGGLLICLSRLQAAAYCKEIKEKEGYTAWIIGIAEKGNRTARLIEKPRIIEVPSLGKDKL